MLKKPFYSSMAIMTLPPLSVFLINFALIYFCGSRKLQESSIDNIFHTVGGITATISLAGLFWHLARREIVKIEDTRVFRFVIFGFLCFLLIGWEILEYVMFYPNDLLVYSDTISDMVFGLSGGLLAIPFIRRIL